MSAIKKSYYLTDEKNINSTKPKILARSSYANYKRKQLEAVNNPNHSINNDLRAYFLETQRKLEKIKENVQTK